MGPCCLSLLPLPRTWLIDSLYDIPFQPFRDNKTHACCARCWRAWIAWCRSNGSRIWCGTSVSENWAIPSAGGAWLVMTQNYSPRIKPHCRCRTRWVLIFLKTFPLIFLSLKDIFIFWFSPLGFSGRKSIVIACVCPSVCKLYLVYMITRHRFELESPNLHQMCIILSAVFENGARPP